MVTLSTSPSVDNSGAPGGSDAGKPGQKPGHAGKIQQAPECYENESLPFGWPPLFLVAVIMVERS